MAKEKNLTAVTSVAAADFARVVTSAGASVKATFANVAKYIVETYNGSTVAGSAQSVKSALDSLNSKTAVSVTAAANVVIDANKSYKCGRVVVFNVKGHATANIDNATLFSFSGITLDPEGFTLGIPIGDSAWTISGITYGYIGSTTVAGRIDNGKYFHISQAFLCS